MIYRRYNKPRYDMILYIYRYSTHAQLQNNGDVFELYEYICNCITGNPQYTDY